MSPLETSNADRDAVVQYRVRHLTKFAYSAPVSESVMELRMQPLSGARQRCLRFDVSTTPRARVFAYRDALGAVVPTNDTLARSRHIGVAIGRDYRDVPPTRGVFKGEAGSELGVAVAVTRVEVPLAADALVPSVRWAPPDLAAVVVSPPAAVDLQQQQQQQ